MNIAITVGHSKLKCGRYTSADGRKYGGCIEYIWCKRFSKQLAYQLRKKGHTVEVVRCPENKFIISTEEKPYKLNRVNSGKFDLIMELHLNADSAGKAFGAEVLYKSEAGKKYAQKIQKGLAQVFSDRGIKERNGLYMLNGTKAPAVIVESFFCTSKSDYKKAKGIVKRRKIAKVIADAIYKCP